MQRVARTIDRSA